MVREFFQRFIQGLRLQLLLFVAVVAGVLFFIFRFEHVGPVPIKIKPMVILEQWSYVFANLAAQDSENILDLQLREKILRNSMNEKDFPPSFSFQKNITYLQKMTWQGFVDFHSGRRAEGLHSLRRSFSVHSEVPHPWNLALALVTWEKFCNSRNEEELEIAAISALYLTHLDQAFAERAKTILEQPKKYQTKFLLEQSQNLLSEQAFAAKQGILAYLVANEIKSPDKIAIAANVASGLHDLFLESDLLALSLQSSEFEPSALTRYRQITVEQLDDSSEFLSLLNRLNAQVPGESVVQYYLGDFYKKQGEKDKALFHFLQVKDGSDFFDQAQIEVSEAFIAQKRFQEAQPILKELNRRYPSSLDLKKKLAINMKQTGAMDKAAVLLDIVTDLSPNDFAAQFELGQIYLYHLGQLQKAEKHLLKAQSINPQNPQLQKILVDLNIFNAKGAHGK